MGTGLLPRSTKSEVVYESDEIDCYSLALRDYGGNPSMVATTSF